MSAPEPGWRDTMLAPGATLAEVIANLDRTGLQIVLVTDPGGRLLGTVTDGDIRRALLRGQGLEARAGEVMSDAPTTLPASAGPAEARRAMVEGRLSQLPVIDPEGRVAGLHLWDEVVAPPRRPNMAVIMAGGFGRRLGPLTRDTPKPMLPVRGRPMLEHVIEHLRSHGIARFAISVFYLAEVIERHFGDGSAFGAEIGYLRETEPLGTAGALSLMEEPPSEPFVVTNGDVITGVDFGSLLDWHARTGAAASMAVREHRIQNPFGVVEIDGDRITGFTEKPEYRSHVNTGIYVLDPLALSHMRRGEHCNMPDLFERLAAAGHRTCAFPLHEDWIDLGRPEDLDAVQGPR